MALSAGTALAALSAISTAHTMQNQKKNAKFQASVAEGQQKASENIASAKRRQGYDSMTQKKLETASEVSSLKAKQGASGGVADFGSNSDVLEDLRKRGEYEARAEYQKGLDSAYSDEVSAWNANARRVKALNEGEAKQTGTLLGGISSLARKTSALWDDGEISL